MQPDQQQSDEEHFAEARVAESPAQPLSDRHAQQCHEQGDDRIPAESCRPGGRGAIGGKPPPQCNGRNGEREPERLYQLVLAQRQALQIGHGGENEHARQRRNEAGRKPHRHGRPALPASRNREPNRAESQTRVSDQRRPQPGRCEARIERHQAHRCRKRADEHAGLHAPQSPYQPEQRRTAERLPEIGDERRNDQQRRRLCRQHKGAEHAHRDRGKP